MKYLVAIYDWLWFVLGIKRDEFNPNLDTYPKGIEYMTDEEVEDYLRIMISRKIKAHELSIKYKER